MALFLLTSIRGLASGPPRPVAAHEIAPPVRWSIMADRGKTGNGQYSHVPGGLCRPADGARACSGGQARALIPRVADRGVSGEGINVRTPDTRSVHDQPAPSA